MIVVPKLLEIGDIIKKEGVHYKVIKKTNEGIYYAASNGWGSTTTKHRMGINSHEKVELIEDYKPYKR